MYLLFICLREAYLASHLLLLCSRIVQLIQTVSAIDRDDPQEGQHFYYSLAPEAANNPNFTLRDNQGNQSRRGQLATLISNVRVGLESLWLTVCDKTAISDNTKWHLLLKGNDKMTYFLIHLKVIWYFPLYKYSLVIGPPFLLRGNVSLFCANLGLVVRLQASWITRVEIAFVEKEMLKGRLETGMRIQIWRELHCSFLYSTCFLPGTEMEVSHIVPIFFPKHFFFFLYAYPHLLLGKGREVGERCQALGNNLKCS